MPEVFTDEYTKMYKEVPQRKSVWAGVCKYIQEDVGHNKTVLDVACGYGDFINTIKAAKKIATDINPAFKSHLAKDVEFHAGSCYELKAIQNNSVDVVFMSNLLEHLTVEEAQKTLAEVTRVLRKDGKFIILQPNFFYAWREYFHDWTHKTIYTHVGMVDFLELHGFRVTKLVPRLVPFSMQSKYSGLAIPSFLLNKTLIYLYLKLPFKFLAKQMYFVSKKAH